MKINELNLSSPIGIDQVDWSKTVNIYTILCPFIKVTKNECFFLLI